MTNNKKIIPALLGLLILTILIVVTFLVMGGDREKSTTSVSSTNILMGAKPSPVTTTPSLQTKQDKTPNTTSVQENSSDAFTAYSNLIYGVSLKYPSTLEVTYDSQSPETAKNTEFIDKIENYEGIKAVARILDKNDEITGIEINAYTSPEKMGLRTLEDVKQFLCAIKLYEEVCKKALITPLGGQDALVLPLLMFDGQIYYVFGSNTLLTISISTPIKNNDTSPQRAFPLSEIVSTIQVK